MDSFPLSFNNPIAFFQPGGVGWRLGENTPDGDLFILFVKLEAEKARSCGGGGGPTPANKVSSARGLTSGPLRRSGPCL